MLIKGEPGTGKSLVAQLIHSLGLAPERPFVTVEGSAMADEHSMQQPDDLHLLLERTTRSIGRARRLLHPAALSTCMKSRRCRWSCSSTCFGNCNFETMRRARATLPELRATAHHVDQRKSDQP